MYSLNNMAKMWSAAAVTSAANHEEWLARPVYVRTSQARATDKTHNFSNCAIRSRTERMKFINMSD